MLPSITHFVLLLVLQPVAVCGSQCVAVCRGVHCSALQCARRPFPCAAVCCRVLQCFAVCCSVWSVLQCVAVCCSVLQCVLQCALKCVAVCCCVLKCALQCVSQCVAVCCSVLQCVAVCVAVFCSASQCVAVCCTWSFSLCCSLLHVYIQIAYAARKTSWNPAGAAPVHKQPAGCRPRLTHIRAHSEYPLVASEWYKSNKRWVPGSQNPPPRGL